MSLAYSSVYGNKIRKLWKLLAKNDMLTSTSYEFSNPNDCKVKDCNFKVKSFACSKEFSLLIIHSFHQAKTAMETFRHIRENHLTEIKQLKIKIGQPPDLSPQKPFRRPGPRSKTRPGCEQVAATDQEISGGHMTMMDTDNIEEEEMDFESAINSIQHLSQDSEAEMVLTGAGDEATISF